MCHSARLVGSCLAVRNRPRRPGGPSSKITSPILSRSTSSSLPTATFRVLYVFVVLLHQRRRIVHFNVTDSPTAAWTLGSKGLIRTLHLGTDYLSSAP